MAGISPGNKYPRAFITVKYGAGQQSPLTAPKKILVVGYAARVGPSTGTGTDGVVYPLPSIDDAILYFGGGSEVYNGAEVVLDQARDASVYGISYPELVGGTYTEFTLTITNAATLGGTLFLYFNGNVVEVAIPAGTTANDQATLVYTTVGKYKNLPIYMPAAPGANVVTFRWKHKGLRSQQMAVRYKVEAITNTTYVVAQSVAGVSDANPNTALDKIAARDFDFIVCPDDTSDASTGIKQFVTYADNRADPLISLRGVVVAAFRGSYASMVTLSTAINAHRCFLAWCRNAEDTSVRIAGRHAAAIMAGTASDPTANINFTKFKHFFGPVLEGDWITEQEATNALNNGITPIRFTQQGQPYFPRPITSRFQDVNGNPDYRTLDVGKVLMPDYLADYFEQDIPVTFEGYKLRDDDPNDQGMPLDKVMTPKLFKSYMAGALYREYKLSRLKNPEPYINGDGGGAGGVLKSYIHPSVPSRLVADMPVDIIDIMAQVDMTLRQLG